MPEDFIIGAKLGQLVDRMVASYHADARTQHIDRIYLPSRDQIVQLVSDLLELLYPGFIGRQRLTKHNVVFHVGDLLPRIGETAFRQIYACMCYMCEHGAADRASGQAAAHAGQGPSGHAAAHAGEGASAHAGTGPAYRHDATGAHEGNAHGLAAAAAYRPDVLPRVGDARSAEIVAAEGKAREATVAFLEGIPQVREMLAGDVQAAYDGDPAALNVDEVILAYPGLLAISIHRLAHSLYKLNVPLLPRIMSEWAHNQTGIDIHPGATIGRSFFIDHGTGVVIGETTHIGNSVKIYQGVTLGALSFRKDERGRVIRGSKRHPTIADSVTIYANAIILGGDTVIGEGSVIGGSVFVTSSVPPNSVVTFKPPELRLKTKGEDKPQEAGRAEAVAPAGAAAGSAASRAKFTEPANLPDYMI